MIGSAIGGFLGMAGGNAAAGAAYQGAGAIKEAMDRANQEAINQRRENRSDLSPWMAAGTSALSEIGKLLGWGNLYNPGQVGTVYNYVGDEDRSKQKEAFSNFFTSPGYQFRRDEGIKALDRSASAKGRLLSGAQMKGVQNFGDGLAADEYGNYTNTLLNLAGLGNSATSTLAGNNSSVTTANNSAQVQGGIARGSAYTQAGNAMMQGYNALASGIGSGTNNMMGAYLFRNYLFGGGGGGSLNSLMSGPSSVVRVGY